jgi:acetaldehyde dehydrogenase (acetylating)
MTPGQADLVRSTFATAASRVPRGETLASLFYTRLFERHPQMRHLFSEDITLQAQRMVDTLASMVENVDQPDVLAGMLIPLGRRHGPYGAAARQFEPVIAAIGSVVAEGCGADWSPEAEQAWSEVFGEVERLFLAGLDHAGSEQDSTPQIVSFAQTAAAEYRSYSQEQVDAICEAIVKAGWENRVMLAEMAVEETEMGRVRSKVVKNELCTRGVWDDICDLRTVGVIGGSVDEGVLEVAQPMGVVLAVIPVTNPTSTTLFKIISALKARNSVIVTAAGRARDCTNEAARIAYQAALAAGAPPNVIQWVPRPNRDTTQKLMAQKDIAIIMATGGEGLVTSAYSSGTPALGVGAGNVPVFVHSSGDLDLVADNVIESKNFDYGTICASEQSIVVTQDRAAQLIAEFEQRGALLLSDEEAEKLAAIAVDPDRGTMNPKIVGRDASTIATAAGIDTPPDVTLLIAPQTQVGIQAPLSQEILAPIICLYIEPDEPAALARTIELNHYGGVGHTAVIYANDVEAVARFGNMVTAGRVLVNVGSSTGAVGGGTALFPSMTLGCGTQGGNITTVNVTARDLMNIQRVAFPR